MFTWLFWQDLRRFFSRNILNDALRALTRDTFYGINILNSMPTYKFRLNGSDRSVESWDVRYGHGGQALLAGKETRIIQDARW